MVSFYTKPSSPLQLQINQKPSLMSFYFLKIFFALVRCWAVLQIVPQLSSCVLPSQMGQTNDSYDQSVTTLPSKSLSPDAAVCSQDYSLQRYVTLFFISSQRQIMWWWWRLCVCMCDALACKHNNSKSILWVNFIFGVWLYLHD